MRVHLRETGSIHVKARKDEVLDILRSAMKNGAVVAPDRLEGRGATFVVRDEADGTRVYHMRSEAASVAAASREREVLRRAVQSELFQLQRVFEVKPR
jgi:hypothetical protein